MKRVLLIITIIILLIIINIPVYAADFYSPEIDATVPGWYNIGVEKRNNHYFFREMLDGSYELYLMKNSTNRFTFSWAKPWGATAYKYFLYINGTKIADINPNSQWNYFDRYVFNATTKLWELTNTTDVNFGNSSNADVLIYKYQNNELAYATNHDIRFYTGDPHTVMFGKDIDIKDIDSLFINTDPYNLGGIITCITPADNSIKYGSNLVTSKWKITIPLNAQSNSYKLIVSGYIDESDLEPPLTPLPRVISEVVTYKDGYQIIKLEVEGHIPKDEKTDITVSCKDSKGKIISKSIYITAYEILVDVDLDGIDDREQQNFIERNESELDEGVLAINKNNLIVDSAKFLSSMIPPMATFLPPTIITLMGFGVTVIVILRIMGR